MELKLKSVLRSQQSILLFKALIFLGFLALVYIGNFSLVPILFFLTIAIVLYSKPIFNTFYFWASFLILLVMALNSPPSLLIAVFYSFLFYIILGLKNLVFINRVNWHQALHLLLFYAIFMLFWGASDETAFIFKLVGVFAASTLLIREFFKVAAVDFLKQRILASWVLALLVVETVWAISWLPIGFLNSAALALLAVFVLINLTLHHFKGTLNKKVVLSAITLFILFTLLIFITSKWGI